MEGPRHAALLCFVRAGSQTMPENETASRALRSAAGVTFVVSIDAAEGPARLIADRLGETVDTESMSISLFETDAGHWRVCVHCAGGEAAARVRTLVAAAAGASPAAIAVDPLARQDWVAASLAGLTPVRAGRFFVHGAHDRTKTPVNAVAIELEAALAFGTGHHGTTRGCLLALDRLMKARRPRRILDVGTGTAVLAIAAAKALRRPVLASDIDPQAVRIARANARANGVGGLVEVLRADGPGGRRFGERGPYDLILANILLGPLQRLSLPIARLAARGGRVVLSGLLPGHANAALSAYRRQGLHLERRIALEGWTTLVLTRRRREKPRTVIVRGLS
jgi:ribosomal protein L11 methyltransferase